MINNKVNYVISITDLVCVDMVIDQNELSLLYAYGFCLCFYIIICCKFLSVFLLMFIITSN
jgi:ABC-type amino acid transport system permease subunit